MKSKRAPRMLPPAYYAYLQGTSMASPHATGVAAVIVSEFGKRDKKKGGLELRPDSYVPSPWLAGRRRWIAANQARPITVPAAANSRFHRTPKTCAAGSTRRSSSTIRNAQ